LRQEKSRGPKVVSATKFGAFIPIVKQLFPFVKLHSNEITTLIKNNYVPVYAHKITIVTMVYIRKNKI
jgi:hypothetical protein